MFDMRKIQEQTIAQAIARRSDEATARSIVHGEDGNENDAQWVNATMKRLEDAFDVDTVKRIRMDCQCGYGMEEKVALVKRLMVGATDMASFAGSDAAREAGLFCRDGELYLQFTFCPCPMLAQVQRLRSKTWCQCSAGYSKALFEKAFSCEVDAELLKSIKGGDEVCLMKITPQGRVF